VHARAAHARGRQERTELAHRQRKLVGLVAERERAALGFLEDLLAHRVAQFILDVRDGKSGTVSRQPPRSSASTLAPASVSSCAMTEAVQPKPTSTTSTSGSLFAI